MKTLDKGATRLNLHQVLDRKTFEKQSKKYFQKEKPDFCRIKHIYFKVQGTGSHKLKPIKLKLMAL